MILKKGLFTLLLIFLTLTIIPQNIDLLKEHSFDEFQNGIRAYHNAEYEQAITFFLKSLGHNEDNHLSRYFLGESYRKAGYEKNAIFTWNNLLALGYEDRNLKNKVAYLYNKRGMLNEININKNLLLKEDVKGYISEKSLPIFIKPSQITVDNNNHYFIASFLTGLVVEMDPNLKVVKNHFALLEKIEKPFGVVVDKEGYIYISDFKKDVIFKIDKMGIIKDKIGYKGIGDGALLGPEYLLMDNDENIYVVDSGNRRINKYKKNGDFLFSFGKNKDGNIGIKSPAGMFFYDNNIYICDKAKNKIVVFDKNGNHLFSFGNKELERPYDLTRDKYGRFIILCEKKVWAYEKDNDLWYIIDATGNRLERGISISLDKENNILITDYNRSRLYILGYERERYTNLNLNIERAFSQKFPEVHLAVTIEKDDFSIPQGIDTSNVMIFENGKKVNIVGTSITEDKNSFTDILFIYDNNIGMDSYKDDINMIMDNWLRNKKQDTFVSFVTIKQNEAILTNDFNSTRLSILDTIDRTGFYEYTDKGEAIKLGIYHMLRRFSKKAVVLITNSKETGRDFEKFKLENCIALARNNNIPIYVVSFDNGQLDEIYRYIAKKTEGEYYRVYKDSGLNDLIMNIENKKGKEMVFSYTSKAVSRFGEEPISVIFEIEYGGMSGVGKTVYYPERPRPFE